MSFVVRLIRWVSLLAVQQLVSQNMETANTVLKHVLSFLAVNGNSHFRWHSRWRSAQRTLDNTVHSEGWAHPTAFSYNHELLGKGEWNTLAGVVATTKGCTCFFLHSKNNVKAALKTENCARGSKEAFWVHQARKQKWNQWNSCGRNRPLVAGVSVGMGMFLV